jgi:hypothetical protein
VADNIITPIAVVTGSGNIIKAIAVVRMIVRIPEWSKSDLLGNRLLHN